MTSLLIARYNPLGLEAQFRGGLQQRLYASSAPVAKDNFLFLGASPKINLAVLKFGPSVELQPLSILNLRAAVELVDYFSSFGYLQSFPSPSAAYSDTDLNRGREEGRNYAAIGRHAMLEALFQFKIKAFVIRNKIGFEAWHVPVRSPDTVFYDGVLDTLVPARGWVIVDDLDLVIRAETGPFGGVRYSTVQPLYTRDDFGPSEDPSATDNSHHRVGPVVGYTFFDDGASRFNKPTVFAMANWYLHHRYRTGAEVSAAVPYLLAGFSFQSDFWATSNRVRTN